MDANQTADAPLALSDAELAALGVTAADQGLDRELHFSGFMDVNYMQLMNPKDVPLVTTAYGNKPSMFVGHLNLYLNKNITDTFRMMAEVRFTYSPNGATSSVASPTPTDTQVSDYNGTGSFVRWGGIVIERAYGEWSPLSFLTLRVGAFLTPYGIWNVDHGSPVFIPVLRPYAVSGAYFPEHQTGIEALGRWGLSSKLSMRYHLTLSNGLGPVSEYRDLDKNKAVGGRLALEYVGLGTLQIGGSAFYGETTGGAVGLLPNSNGTSLVVNQTIASQAWVTSMAADVLWKFRGLHLQAEWVAQRLDYTKAGRTQPQYAGVLGIPAGALLSDALNWGGYGLLGYRLPWWGIMPFGTVEYQHTNNAGFFVRTAYSQLGLNIRPADAVVLKLEYEFAFAGNLGPVKMAMAQLAWAF